MAKKRNTFLKITRSVFHELIWNLLHRKIELLNNLFQVSKNWISMYEDLSEWPENRLFSKSMKIVKNSLLQIDFSLICSKETPQYVCKILKPLKRAFQNWSYMPKMSISKGITTILSKAYKISKIMLFPRRSFLLKIGKPYWKWNFFNRDFSSFGVFQ